MSQEQPPTIEKDPALEGVKMYFKKEEELYSPEGRDRIEDRVLRLNVAKRLKRITGYEEYEAPENKKVKKIPGLLEKFEKEDYEDCLSYIEEILGGEGVEQAKNKLDLINHREYGPDISIDRNKDIETREYQNRKNYLRKLADVLTGEIYEKKKAKLDEILLEKEREEIFKHIASSTGKDLFQVRKEFKSGYDRDVLEFLDDKIGRDLKELESLDKKKDKAKIKARKEEIFKLRRYRRYFLNLQEKKE